MNPTLTPELYWTVLTALLTSVMWVPHIFQRIFFELGLHDALRDPCHDVPTQADWAQRIIRAHTNAVENLVVFGLLAVVIQILGVSTALSAMAAEIYFFARLGHFAVYTFGVPWLRTPLYLAGFICQLILGGTALGIV